MYIELRYIPSDNLVIIMIDENERLGHFRTFRHLSYLCLFYDSAIYGLFSTAKLSTIAKEVYITSLILLHGYIMYI